MSYVIHIWEGPEPATLEEAERLIDRLDIQTLPPGGTQKLEAFRQALIKRFPQEASDEDSVWLDDSIFSPPDGTPILAVGVLSDWLDEVIPFMAQTARATGVVVYDGQYGTAYLPSGRTLGNIPPPPAADAPVVLSDRTVLPVLRAELTPFMTEQGFKWKKIGYRSGFVHPFDGGWTFIGLGSLTRLEGASILVHAGVHFDAIDAYMNRLKFPGNDKSYETVGGRLIFFLKETDPELAARLLCERGEEFLVSDMAEVVRFAQELIGLLRDRWLPAIYPLESIQEVWRHALVGMETGRKSSLFVSASPAVIAGRLLGDPRYVELGQFFSKTLRPSDVADFLAFVDRVGTEVQPLTTP